MAKIEKPNDVVLGPNQSWNKQHGYVQTEANHCDEDALKAAYDAAGRPPFLTWIKEQSKAGVALPSYPTCVAWMGTKKGAIPKAASAVATTTVSSSLSTDFMKEFEAEQEASRKAALKAFLTKKQKALTEALAELEVQLKALEPKAEEKKEEKESDTAKPEGQVEPEEKTE